jgi:hypothetical protein
MLKGVGCCAGRREANRDLTEAGFFLANAPKFERFLYV